MFRDKAFNISKNPKNDEDHCGIASMDYFLFFIKRLQMVLLKMKM